MNIRDAGKLDMRRPENINDRRPAPDLAPRPPHVAPADWPSGFTLAEAATLAALHERAPSTLAALGDALGVACDVLRPTLRRLADRGLVVAFGPYNAAFRLTRPTGRALARLLADNLPRCGANVKE